LGNTDTIRLFLEAFERRDAEAVAALCHPAVRFEPASTEVALRSAYIGEAGMRQYLQDIDATWEQFRLTVHSIREADGKVVALGRVYASARGFVGDDPVGIVCGLRSGKLLWGKVYTSQDAALAAAGLDGNSR
jgi:ketosteroid isomerase-like protein